MNPLRSLVSSLRHPAALSLFGLTRQASTAPQASTSHFLIRRPSPAATRESPYPVVFIRTPDLSSSPRDTEENESWKSWSGMFAEKGFTTVEIDVVPPSYSKTPFAGMVGVLATQIRTLAIPFPPIIVASGTACLLCQKYIEDWGASGIVLINPPPDEDPRGGSLGEQGKEWEWPALSYEPQFPILVMAEDGQLGGMAKTSRIVRAAENGIGRGGKGVSVESLVDGERGEKSRVVSPRGGLQRRVSMHALIAGSRAVDGPLWLLASTGETPFSCCTMPYCQGKAASLLCTRLACTTDLIPAAEE